MCTVIVQVPPARGGTVRMLAVRDEDPQRAWQALGAWWPGRPGVIGVRDVRAGGAWLAASESTGRLAVLLNRHSPALPAGIVPVSRGSIALDSVAGLTPSPTAAVPGFNLVSVDGDAVQVTTWDGEAVRTQTVPPGVHMIAHHDLDDPRSARIAAWRDAFAQSVGAERAEGDESDAVAGQDAPDWSAAWLDVLARSARLDPTDERAIIRDNTPLGYPTQSLLLCVAEVVRGGARVRYAEFEHPGLWNPVTLAAPVP